MKSMEPLKLILTERFRKSALELGPEIRAKLRKQIALLASDPRHPSLRVKKIKGTSSIFEARAKGRAFGSPLARGFYTRASAAEVDPRANPGAPAAVDRDFRFTFEFGGGREIILRVVGPHDPALKRP